jgi:hypothetical protein
MTSKKLTNKQLVELYGPFKEINRAKERKLIAAHKWQHILTIKNCDSDEEPDGFTMYAHVGHGLVDVSAIFESEKPMPEDLEINDFWFDDYLGKP